MKRHYELGQGPGSPRLGYHDDACAALTWARKQALGSRPWYCASGECWDDSFLAENPSPITVTLTGEVVQVYWVNGRATLDPPEPEAQPRPPPTSVPGSG